MVRVRSTGNCAHCGTYFESQQEASRFCSTTCWYSSRKAARTVPCESCGDLFEKKYKTQRACSRKCGNQLKQANRFLLCGYCGSSFEREHGQQSRKYCSRSCAQSARMSLPQAPTYEIGAVRRHSGGYLMEKSESSWVMQHRLIMSRMLGRGLEVFERVHHKNGVRDDNRPENLELWIIKPKSKKDPAGQRMEDLLRCFLDELPRECRVLAEDAFREVFRI